MLERVVGALAVAGVFLAASVIANLVNLSGYPVTVGYGASAAILALYGLFIVTAIAGLRGEANVRFPLLVLRRLLPGTAVFFLYSLSSASLASGAELAAFAIGVAGGVALHVRVTDGRPSLRRVGAAAAAALVIALVYAVPLRGLTDVRPEIARLIEIEDRTASAYKATVTKFRAGRTDTEALVQMIDRKIVPELEAAQKRVSSLERVPADYQPMIASAAEYLRLRDQSWRLRAEGIRKANMAALRKAEGAERDSLEALKPLRAQVPAS
jgi:hypothetical protein